MPLTREQARYVFSRALAHARATGSHDDPAYRSARASDVAQVLWDARAVPDDPGVPGERPTLRDYQVVAHRAFRANELAGEMRGVPDHRHLVRATPFNRGIASHRQRFEYQVAVGHMVDGVLGRRSTLVIFGSLTPLTASQAHAEAIRRAPRLDLPEHYRERYGDDFLTGELGAVLVSVSRFERLT